MKHLRDRGWTVAIVEKVAPYTYIHMDLFGFGDLLAIREGDLPMIVQTTTGDHRAHRRNKILAEPRARLWAATGCAIVLQSWRKSAKTDKWEIHEECFPTKRFDAPVDKPEDFVYNEKRITKSRSASDSSHDPHNTTSASPS